MSAWRSTFPARNSTAARRSSNFRSPYLFMSDIVFDHASRAFKRDARDTLAVDAVSFEVRSREFVAIVGPSGCGKTTCLRMAAGLEFPTSGSITVGGKPVTGPGPDRSVVFQQFALFPWKTVVENIDFGLRANGIAP